MAERYFIGGERRAWRLRTAAAAGACLVLLELAAHGQTYTDKVTTTPFFLQDGFGSLGNALPYNGLEYCCPTSVAMSLSWLGVNGWNQIAPLNPTAADELNLVRVLSGLMSTDPLGGTSSNSDITSAIRTYLSAKGIKAANYSLTSASSPSLATLASLNQGATVVDLIDGYYDSSGNRTGGHCVALLGEAVNAQGLVSPNTLTIGNPLPSTYVPQGDLVSNSVEYLNTVPTSGNIVGKGALQLDPAQYPGYLGTRVVVETAIALTIDTSQLSSNTPTISNWSISGTQTIGLQGGYLSVLAAVTGAGGFSKSDGGTLEMLKQNTSTGANTVVSGVWQSDIVTGTPFGTGAIASESGTLQLTPGAGTAAVAFPIAGGAAGQYTFLKGSALGLNAGSHSSLTVTLGGYSDGTAMNLGRVADSTGTLVLVPATGNASLGTIAKVLVKGTGGNLPALTHGIAAPYFIAEDKDAGHSGDFLTYGSNGFVKASYTLSMATALEAAVPGSIYEASTAQTLSPGAQPAVFALKVGPVTVSGGTGSVLSIGPLTAGTAGLIMNGGTISVPTVDFGGAEALLYMSSAGGTISSTVTGTGGLTAFGPGSVVLSGANTYSGATAVNSGTLVAASVSGSATGASSVLVQQNGTLELRGGAGAGGITIATGGTLLLNGGTDVGSLVTNYGSFVLGSGTVAGAVTFGGTIGSSATDLAGTPYSGVENIAFTGTSITFSNSIYDWRLNALDDVAADAGTAWSLLRFTTPGANLQIGSKSNPFHFTLDLAENLQGPNSGNSFWNLPHQWLVADTADGFDYVWYYPVFGSYSQGSFSLSVDPSFYHMYLKYTPAPVPEPGVPGLWLASGVLLGLRRRRTRV